MLLGRGTTGIGVIVGVVVDVGDGNRVGVADGIGVSVVVGMILAVNVGTTGGAPSEQDVKRRIGTKRANGNLSCIE